MQNCSLNAELRIQTPIAIILTSEALNIHQLTSLAMSNYTKLPHLGKIIRIHTTVAEIQENFPD